jgi:mRNA-degrading endonuclease YafQ of YafQ-DinJ toxin-antitoxin module
MIRASQLHARSLRRLLTLAILTGLLLPAPYAGAETPTPRVPDAYQLTMLIYTTMTALDQANATGNYSVLRELAAPDFQRINPVHKLSGIFAGYRERHVVLAPVVLYQPHLLEAPQLGPEGRLHLKGFFPTRPLRIGFDLTYQFIEGAWRLMALSIAPSQD